MGTPTELFSLSPELAWFAAGVFFMILEALTPGFFLLFFGLGAWAAAAACGLAGLQSLTGQFLVFLVVTVAGLAWFRRKLKFFLASRPGRALDDPDPVAAEKHVGQVVLAIREIGPDRPGLAELHGTNWHARSEAGIIRPGERARVLALDGLTLIVAGLPASKEIEP